MSDVRVSLNDWVSVLFWLAECSWSVCQSCMFFSVTFSGFKFKHIYNEWTLTKISRAPFYSNLQLGTQAKSTMVKWW